MAAQPNNPVVSLTDGEAIAIHFPATRAFSSWIQLRTTTIEADVVLSLGSFSIMTNRPSGATS
jgi:hypothetical protein